MELLLLGAALAAIYVAAVKMVQANRAYGRSNEELRVLAARPVELARAKQRLEGQIKDAADQIGRVGIRIEHLKAEKAALDEELHRLRERAKDRVYVMERVMQPGQTLWELVVSNDTQFRDVADEEYRLSWARGRRYVVSAANERDVRRRAELKFLGSQGYRVLQVERSARF